LYKLRAVRSILAHHCTPTRIFEVLLGGVFIFSAIAKLLVSGEFELYLYHLPALSWNMAVLCSRLLIGGELALGGLLFLNFHPRKSALLATLILTGFTIYLLLAQQPGGLDNCFCFGTALPLDTRHSVLKNLAMLAIAGFLLWKLPRDARRPQWMVISLLTGAFLIPSCFRPPDFMMRNWFLSQQEAAPDHISLQLFDEALVISDSNRVAYGNEVLLCFLSTHCKYCKWTAQRISDFSRKQGEQLPIVYIFNGTANEVDQFWEESHSARFPYYICTSPWFFRYIGKGVPVLFLIQNGQVVKQYGYRSFHGKEVLDYLRPAAEEPL